MQHKYKWTETEILAETSPLKKRGSKAVAKTTNSDQHDKDAEQKELILTRSREKNYRKAEAITMLQSVDQIQQLKTMLVRGYFAEAETLLLELTKNETIDATTRTELLLEQARLESFKGSWSNAALIATMALQNSPSIVSVLTLHQIRSVAYYELGSFDLCRKDLEKMFSLFTMFPDSGLKPFYYTLTIKMYALENKWHLVETFKAELYELFTSHTDKTAKIDLFITILRLEIDLSRIQQLPTNLLSLMVMTFTHNLGDDLYNDLAQLDFAIATNKDHNEYKFERTNKLLQDAKGAAQTTTAKIIANYKPATDLSDASTLPEIIILTKSDLIVNTKTFEIHHIKSAQIKKALLTILEGKKPFDVFFAEVWGMNSYNPEIHSNNVKTLLSRMRKDLAIPVFVKGGEIEIASMEAIAL